MTASMMLKSELGAIVGFLLQHDRRLIYRVKGDGSAATLFIYAEDMRSDSIEISCDSREREVECFDAKINGACLVCNGKIAAITDNSVKARYLMKHVDYAAVNCRNSPNDANVKPVKEMGYQFIEFPERRWPPHACWRSASYSGGYWRDSDEGQ